MTAELDLTIVFDGECWCTSIDNCPITAPELTELEAQITGAVRQLTRFSGHESVLVRMQCESTMLPNWLRQYHSHYFNSLLTVAMPASRTQRIS